ncbi:hypothetical protein SK3146_06813 [Paenibacillus konkukensis]|uniref:Uncharacterized protein n=1 Tax=Paenibacillus konkukensis TaxID=2020716 RepID=A0ABY4RXX4_9BACL|nr:hypothetical protein [Paenibacillus konkukensis]UQZ87511.1 hypothetical protein SK3146_06813 [Paenibacillus konkukensis]
MFLRSKMNNSQYFNLSLDEQFLFYDARNFLRSLITDNTHRIQKWKKRLDGGSVYIEYGGAIKFEIPTPPLWGEM